MLRKIRIASRGSYAVGLIFFFGLIGCISTRLCSVGTLLATFSLDVRTIDGMMECHGGDF